MFNTSESPVEVITGNKYLEPGNYLVKVSKVENKEVGDDKVPYIVITVEDKNELSCTQDYCVKTTISEGKTKSAWNISSQAFYTLIAAANKCTKEEAKNKLGDNSTLEALTIKLSSLLVGKDFAIKLIAQQVIPSDATKPVWYKSRFGNYEFAVTSDKLSTLKSFDSSRDTVDKNGKKLVVVATPTGTPVPKQESAW